MWHFGVLVHILGHVLDLRHLQVGCGSIFLLVLKGISVFVNCHLLKMGMSHVMQNNGAAFGKNKDKKDFVGKNKVLFVTLS